MTHICYIDEFLGGLSLRDGPGATSFFLNDYGMMLREDYGLFAAVLIT